MHRTRKLSLLLLAMALSACGMLHRGTTSPVVAPSPPIIQASAQATVGAPETSIAPTDAATTSTADFGVLQRLIDFTRVDITNALTGATAAKDDIGVQCHTSGLALLDSFDPPQMRVTGIASAAEKVRLVRKSALDAAPKFQELHDRCAALYNVATVFRPILDAVGLARLVLP